MFSNGFQGVLLNSFALRPAQVRSKYLACALIVGVFRNGLALSGLALLWQDFAVGVLIIVAVTIDQWIRKISA